MLRYISIITILLYCCCAPAIKMEPRQDYYLTSRRTLNPSMNMNESDSAKIGVTSYLQGYDEGVAVAMNESYRNYCLGGCFLGMAGTVGGFFAPRIFTKFPGTPVIVLGVTGGIAASVGSDFLMNRLMKVNIPGLITQDTIFQRGFSEGYSNGFKSRRLNESLKGTAIGVGSTFAGAALGYVLLIWMVIQILGSLPM